MGMKPCPAFYEYWDLNLGLYIHEADTLTTELSPAWPWLLRWIRWEGASGRFEQRVTGGPSGGRTGLCPFMYFLLSEHGPST